MNFENLTRSELAAARIECDNSLLFFTRFWFRVLRGSKFIVNNHHEVIEQALREIETYERELLNINIPPRFSKTEIAAVNFIARGIGMNPTSNWLYITASDELRSQTSVSIRDIVHHPYFKIMYGVELKKDQNGKNLWRTNKGGGLKTATIFGQITGFGAGQMINHEKELEDFIRDFEGCIVLDDINKIDDANQENALNSKVSRVLLNTVLSRKNSKDTPIINIQQRAGMTDATAIFQEHYKDSQKARFLVMPVISPDGVPLWPWKYDIEDIDKLKNNPLTCDIFETQYMQRPVRKEGILIPMEDVKFGDVNLIPKENIVWRFSISDPADTGGDRYSNIFVDVAILDGNIACYVKDVIHSTDGIEACVDRVAIKLKEHESESCFLEKNGIGLAAQILLSKKVPKNCQFAPYNAPSGMSKEQKISVHYEFVKRFFIFDAKYKENKEYQEFITHLTTYQKDGDNKHKADAIDVCCSAANFIKLKFHKLIFGT